MCIASVYKKEDDKIIRIMEDVASIEVDGDKLSIFSLLGDNTVLEGKIHYVDFVKHSVILSL